VPSGCSPAMNFVENDSDLHRHVFLTDELGRYRRPPFSSLVFSRSNSARSVFLALFSTATVEERPVPQLQPHFSQPCCF